MLWNWNVIDSCFISSQWRITSDGIFALSCIGVVGLVLTLEFLRRAVKEYDRYLLRQHAKQLDAHTPSGDGERKGGTRFRPTAGQQAVRALLHMCQFAVAYFVML